MSSAVFYAFPSFQYKEEWNKLVASSSHPTHIWGMCADPGCRTREGGWESWAASGGKKVAEQGAASAGPSVLVICFKKREDVI